VQRVEGLSDFSKDREPFIWRFAADSGWHGHFQPQETKSRKKGQVQTTGIQQKIAIATP
jgi:hypothetical protein